MDGVQNLILSQ